MTTVAPGTPAPTSPVEPVVRDKYHLLWGALVAIAAIGMVLIRLRLLSVPLERDEGEYAYGAQLLLDGFPPYKYICSMKWPGIYFAYALILATFGQTIEAIRGGLIVVNLATAVGLYGLARELSNRAVASLATVFFFILSIGRRPEGVMANSEHFVLLPVVFGLWCLVFALRRSSGLWMIAAGLLLGFATVVKQHAALFVVFAAVFIVLDRWPRNRPVLRETARLLLALGGGVAISLGAMLAFVWAWGVWREFYLWTIVYARDYTAQVSWPEAVLRFKLYAIPILLTALPIFFLAAAGLLASVWRAPRRRRLFLAGFAIASFAAVCPGWYFRPHYFLFLMPAVALCAGLGLQGLAKVVGGRLRAVSAGVLLVALFLLAVGFPLCVDQLVLFELPPPSVSRRMYELNPFPESIPIADYLARYTDPGEQIAIFGSEPQILFYAHRRSATSLVYMYPLTEVHPYVAEMQQQLISEVEAARPQFIVMVNISFAWLPAARSHPHLLQWMQKFLDSNYTVCSYVVTENQGKSTYVFSDDPKKQVEAPYYSAISVWRRKM